MIARWPRSAYEGYCGAERQQDRVSAVTALFIARPLCLQSEHLAGFAAFSAVSIGGHTECELGNMAVTEEWRRRGIGRRLLMSGALWARTWCSAPEPSEEQYPEPEEDEIPNLSFWLEVRASNRGAIAFYESVGFQVAGRRTDYYAHPQEDAFRMTALALR